MKILLTYLIYHLIYSVLGWIYESIYCSIDQKTIVNRGFFYGPDCPIYGCAAIVDIILLGKIKEPVLVFFLGMLISCVIEYSTSYILETIFHRRWWDYSDKILNLQGRICLLGAVTFGFFSLFSIKILHPLVVLITNHAIVFNSIYIIIFFLPLICIDGIITFFKHSHKHYSDLKIYKYCKKTILRIISLR